MNRRRRELPDPAHARLEERVLLAAEAGPSPVLLTPSGYVVAMPGSGGASPLTPNSIASNPGYGVGIASGFYLTGFGMSVMQIGNPLGFPGAGVPGPSASSLGSGATLLTAGAAGNPLGSTRATTPNPPGQSLPLTPGSGFRNIGQPAAAPNPGATGAPLAATTATPPVAPVAPLDAIVPPTSPPGALTSPNPSVLDLPATPPASAALPGIITSPPISRPPISGTIPTLPGTLPDLNPGSSP